MIHLDKTDGLKAHLSKLKQKFPESVQRKALILYFLQISLIILLLFTTILSFFVNENERRLFYVLLVSSLELLLVSAFLLTLSGKYKPSSLLTVITMIIGPWGSILFDSSVAQGDFIPIIYIILPIQLCSIFLTERVTISIAVVQLVFLGIFFMSNPAFLKINWPSLLCLVLFSSTLGTVTSFVSHKQMDQIESDRKQLTENEQRLLYLSERDSLTGLYNRRYMESVLEKEISRAIQYGHSIGIIIADVDGFKIINDTYGHVLGDFILSKAAAVLASGIRKSDIPCRYGGDEFVLILPDCTLEETGSIAEKLRKEMSEARFENKGKPFGQVTLSVGVAALPDNGLTWYEVLKAADTALYIAKSKGRNRVSVSTKNPD